MATSWADRVITVSEPCRRILEGRGLPGEKVTVLPNTQPTYLTAPHVTPQKPVLITHTTVIERYGVQVAIQAVHQLARAWPDLTYQVFGDGEYLPVVRELVQELGVADRTVFHGFVPADELVDHIGTATLGIVPILGDVYGSLLLPTKLFAYVAMGLPVVCSRTPTIEEYFPADCLAYFTPGDASDLAIQVERLLRDPELAREQADRARE